MGASLHTHRNSLGPSETLLLLFFCDREIPRLGRRHKPLSTVSWGFLVRLLSWRAFVLGRQ